MNSVCKFFVDLFRCLCQVQESDQEHFEGLSSVDTKKARVMRRDLFELNVKSQMLDAAQIELATYKRVLKKKNDLIAAAAVELDEKDRTIANLLDKVYGQAETC